MKEMPAKIEAYYKNMKEKRIRTEVNRDSPGALACQLIGSPVSYLPRLQDTFYVMFGKMFEQKSAGGGKKKKKGKK